MKGFIHSSVGVLLTMICGEIKLGSLRGMRVLGSRWWKRQLCLWRVQIRVGWLRYNPLEGIKWDLGLKETNQSNNTWITSNSISEIKHKWRKVSEDLELHIPGKIKAWNFCDPSAFPKNLRLVLSLFQQWMPSFIGLLQTIIHVLKVFPGLYYRRTLALPELTGTFEAKPSKLEKWAKTRLSHVFNMEDTMDLSGNLLECGSEANFPDTNMIRCNPFLTKSQPNKLLIPDLTNTPRVPKSEFLCESNQQTPLPLTKLSWNKTCP